jgi:hypothetical protein
MIIKTRQTLIGPISINAKQCKGINHSYRDKRSRTHLPLTKVIAQNLQLQALPNFSDNVHSTRINHRAQTYKADKPTDILRTKTNQKKTLKERIKGYDRLDGSLKHTNRA